MDRSRYGQKEREHRVCQYDIKYFKNYAHIFPDTIEKFELYIYIFLDTFEDSIDDTTDNDATAEGAGRHRARPNRHDALHMRETMQGALLRIKILSQ